MRQGELLPHAPGAWQYQRDPERIQQQTSAQYTVVYPPKDLWPPGNPTDAGQEGRAKFKHV